MAAKVPLHRLCQPCCISALDPLHHIAILQHSTEEGPSELCEQGWGNAATLGSGRYLNEYEVRHGFDLM